MREIVIKVKKSSGLGFYNISFNYNEVIFSLQCDCQAGLFGKLCKHKRSVACCDLKIAFDDDQREKILTLHKILKELGVKDKISEIESELLFLEKQKKDIIGKEKSLKLELEKYFKQGSIN